jgi:AbiV family abortive infection protein
MWLSIAAVILVCVTYPPVPPFDHLQTLFRAAMANAHDLLDDAELLMRAGSYPRAHALATLSLEEQSKGDMCMLAALVPEITPEHFWGDFRDHQSKLRLVHGLEVIAESEPIQSSGQWQTEAKGRSASSQAQKLRGLYVDYRKGRILLPSQIGERAARKQIKLAKETLTEVEHASSDMDDEVLAALVGGIFHAIQGEPDATTAALDEFMRGGSPNALKELIIQATVTDPACDEA